MRDGGGALSEEQLERLARYFDEEVTFSRHIGAKVCDAESNLVSLGTGAFRVFEKRGNAIV